MGDLQYRAAVLAGAALLFFLLVRLRYCGEVELPPKPRKPSVEARDAKLVAKELNDTQVAYNNHIKVDAAQLGVRVPGPQELRAPLLRRTSEKNFELAVKQEPVEVAGLGLRLVEERVPGSRYKHMILEIENLGNRALAYRIDAVPSSGVRSCVKMVDLPHNATAIPPRALIRRSVCAYRPGWTLKVEEVETLELSELSFHYVSGVPIEALSTDHRGLSKHQVSKEAVQCEIVLSAPMRKLINSGKIHWRDQIDFYARHPCQSYDFPTDYRAFVENDPRALPVSTP